MKLTILLLLLCPSAFAQKIESNVVTTLVSKARAVQIFNGAKVESGDFVAYKDGDSVAGKIAVLFKREVFTNPNSNREALKDALTMSLGFASGKPILVDCSHGVSRGQDCTVHGKHVE